jgi:hypothetical protein
MECVSVIQLGLRGIGKQGFDTHQVIGDIKILFDGFHTLSAKIFQAQPVLSKR